MTAPDPADYGRLPGDADFIRSIPGHEALTSVPADQRYDMARRMGLMRRHTDNSGRAIVDLPQDVQLGSRWRHLLTDAQIREANAHGQFTHLLSGHDPDAATPGPVDNHDDMKAALGHGQDHAEGAATS